MNAYDVKRLALVLAVQAEIEGMKSYNTYRELFGHSGEYGDNAFQAKAEELKILASLHDDQL